MRVAFDHQIFSIQRYGGISRYFRELALNFLESPTMQLRIGAMLHSNSYLSEIPAERLVGARVPWIPGTIELRLALNGSLVKRWLHRYEPDVLHETYYASQAVSSRKTKIVITVHDLIHERFPHFYRATDRTPQRRKAAIDRADHIICPSASTRNDLQEFYKVSDDRVSVIPHGCRRLPSARTIERNTGDPFILYVGHRGLYKNFHNLLRAFAAVQQQHANLLLVCFGGKAFSSAERDSIRGMGVSGRIFQLMGSDHVLAELYEKSAALVYPSQYEGFGMPILEAMAWGCPVACSNVSSLPEVGGDSAIYFDPDDVESIRESILEILRPERQRELRARGLEHAARFTWTVCARRTEELYRRMAAI